MTLNCVLKNSPRPIQNSLQTLGKEATKLSSTNLGQWPIFVQRPVQAPKTVPSSWLGLSPVQAWAETCTCLRAQTKRKETGNTAPDWFSHLEELLPLVQILCGPNGSNIS